MTPNTSLPSLPALAIAGPTASGKSAAALALAQALAAQQRVEIISVDSALIYRGMDIGTAKPTALERASVVHHLVDIRDAGQSYSAAEFVRDATRLIGEIRSRGALALLVGGTMMYFKALLYGLDEMPGADTVLRAQLDAQAAAIGWPAMHARLARVDPASAARLAPADSQRIQRALEVWHLSGRPLSSFHAGKPIADSVRLLREENLFSLEPSERSWLHARIATRFDSMLQQGFLDEVRRLRARGDLNADLPSMRCVGYRQAWQTLEGEQPLATLPERVCAATRQLAKRQLTWLRAMPARQVIACDAPDASAQLVHAALARLPLIR